MNGFLRLASCVPELRVGDPSFNTARILERVYDTLNEHNIQIPFPQRDVHIIGQ